MNKTCSQYFSFRYVKFIYSEKATKFCEISTLDLSYVVTVRSTMEISQTFVAFSEYMNFNNMLLQKGFYPTVPTPLKLNINDDESNNAE